MLDREQMSILLGGSVSIPSVESPCGEYIHVERATLLAKQACVRLGQREGDEFAGLLGRKVNGWGGVLWLWDPLLSAVVVIPTPYLLY